MKKYQKYLFLFSGAYMTVIVITTSLFYYGIFHFNNLSLEKYPIQGVDVSSYQGVIDWDILSAQNITFAFIKATEGSSYSDKFFLKNWIEANKTNLYVGAYHFFSFESKGKTQAEQCPIWVRRVYGKPNFIENNEWAFWQFSNRHHLDGYKGEEKYIDMNVYNGNLDDFIREFSLK